MSRGLGRIQRAIEAAFAKSPRETFSVEELGPVAYPGLNRVEKKHRVAILRAAYALLNDDLVGWCALGSERRGGHVIFCNMRDHRSYALGRLRVIHGEWRSLSDIVALLDDPKDRCHKNHQPGGSWWLQVELVKAKHSGSQERAAKLQKQVDEQQAHFHRLLGY